MKQVISSLLRPFFARRGLLFACAVILLLFLILAMLAYGMAHAGPDTLTSLRASIPGMLSGEKAALKSLTRQASEKSEDRSKDKPSEKPTEATSPEKSPPDKTGPQIAREPGDGQSWLVSGLELDAPQRLSRPDVVFVTAKVKAASTARVEVIWHVEGTWDHPNVKTRFEIRDDHDKDDNVLRGRRVQIVIPDVSGIVRVFAVAIVEGKPTYKGLAMTLIEMNYAPLHRPDDGKGDGKTAEGRTVAPSTSSAGPVAPAPAPPTPAPAPVKPKLLVYFVIDSLKGDVNLNDMLTSVGLRNRIRALGMTPKVFDKDSEDVVRNGLTPYLPKDGIPALVIASASPERKVYKSVPCPKTIQGILDELAK